MKVAWHSLSSRDVLTRLGSSNSGISESEAKKRLSEYGYNELKGKKKISPFIVFLRQFLSPLIYVLLIASILSIFMGHFMDAAVIMVVVLLNAVIGFIQETRAEKAMEALIQMAAPKAKVERGGKILLLPSRQIVPGDVLLLETGDRVPSDARLIETSNLKVNESTLTGESMPVDKSTGVLGEKVPIAERKNIIYMGTIVTYGRATAIAVNTGMSTEIGQIATAIQEVEPEKTPLQKSINKLSQYIVFLFLGVCGILVAVGLLQGMEWMEVFLLAVAAAVSAIPEGLPAVVTVVLAIGMRVMAQRNAIIRKLIAVETLGSATVICSDKTGTLTLNEMTVRRLYINGNWIEVTGEGYEPVGTFKRGEQVINAQDELPLTQLLRIGALCNDALLSMEEEENASIFGDPTEGALVVAAAKAGFNKERLEKAFPRLDEIPFQSEKQYMATLHPVNGKRLAYIKGAVDRLIPLCNYTLKTDGITPLGNSDVEEIVQANNTMAEHSMRVMAIAYAELSPDIEDLKDEHIQENLIFVGLAGMSDPPREEARGAIRLCREAGIRVVMITGDHKLTAQSIAGELGLSSGKALTGTDIQHMSDDELQQEVLDTSIFARIEPLHKLRIVNALKSHGDIVAMTGDGVNDAPALKTANIGIAMGITGTDVAKEASDMILADDNFASVVAAVEEGRAIFNRLRNVIAFFISTNMGELLALILGVLFIGEAPLLAVQILWVNLVTDTSTGIPLGLEPKYGDELKKQPRHPKVGLIFPGMLLRILFVSVIIGVGVTLIFNWAQVRYSIEEARTIAFCTMVSFELFRAFNARSDEHTIFKLGFFSNRWLVISIGLAVALQLMVVYAPFMQVAFSTVPLGLDKWGIIIAAGGGLFIIDEIRKIVFPKIFTIGKWQPLSRKERQS